MNCKKTFLAVAVLIVLLSSNNKGISQISDSCKDVAIFETRFKKGKVFLTAVTKRQLDSIIPILMCRPFCKVEVAGNTGNSCELCSQRAWDRTFSVVTHLTNNGVCKDRIIFRYGEYIGYGSVKISLNSNEGSSMVPAPIPCYSRYKLTKRRCDHLVGHVTPDD
jgi:hypothetical protein